MKELRLHELLRYAFSGGIGLAMLLLVQPHIRESVKQLDAFREAALVGGTVLVIGAFIYNLHRSLLFPPMFRFALLRVLKWSNRRIPGFQFWPPYRPESTEIDFDLWRWRSPFKHHWDEWGAQVHFLYCSAWATCFSLVAGVLSGNSGWKDLQHRKTVLAMAAIMFLAAFVHHCRLLYMIVQVKDLSEKADQADTDSDQEAKRI